ncbi:MAG: hypothetical protein ACR2PG_15965 [Hyphomicrobiaceae bacterium]
MLSQENFNRQLTETQAHLSEWAESYQDIAEYEIEDEPSFWRIAVEPRLVSLCPIELVLRADRQFDLILCDATIEDQTIDDLNLFKDIFRSVADGAVILRRHVSPATDLHLGDTAIVRRAHKDSWSHTRLTAAGRRMGLTMAIDLDRTFAPYELEDA